MDTQGTRERLDKRYSQFGGITRLLRSFRENQVSLDSIADDLDVSRETVRQDFIRFLGRPAYNEIIEERRPKPMTDKDYTVAAAVEELRKEGRASDDATKLALASLLQEVARHVDSITVMRSPGGAWRFSVGDQPLYLRAAIPQESYREYQMGFFRFKPGGYQEPGFAVFGMCKMRSPHDVLAAHVFKTTEVQDTRSLNLRFTKFERTSKWDYARNRWSLLVENRKVRRSS